MNEDLYAIIWGTIALVLGLVILFFVFSNAFDIAQNPSEKLNEWVPEETKDPVASFIWWSDGTSVDFDDASIATDAELKSWYWEFGDEETSTQQMPHHSYSEAGDYTVRLEVEDENGRTSSAMTRVNLIENESSQGQTQQAMSFDIGIGSSLQRMAVTLLWTGVFAIMVMIGGRILIAGCRLLRPVPHGFKIHLKPSDMTVEIPKKQDEPKKKSWFRRK